VINMSKSRSLVWLKFWLSMMLVVLLAPVPVLAQVDITVSGDPGFNTTANLANVRMVDFTTATIATEGTSRLTTSGTALTSGTVSGGNPSSFSGGYTMLLSGTGAAQTATINFVTPTSYVGFLWNLSVDAENTLKVIYTLNNGSTVTVSNCRAVSSGCVGGYVPSGWLSNLITGLLGFLFGGTGTAHYETAYLSYIPTGGLKISSVQLYAAKWTYSCGLLNLFTCTEQQQVAMDGLRYVDASVPPDHLNVTTTTSSTQAGSSVTYTITACGNAACSTYHTAGVTGTLAIAGVTPTFPSGAAFTINPGSYTTTVTVQMTAGTGTASITSPSPSPSNTPKYFCGMGVAAASANSCAITLTPPHHLELTTSSATAQAGSTVTFTVKACADASCATLFTGGASGTLAIAGVTPTFPSGAGFTMASGSSSTTVTARMTTGTATASISAPSPTPSNTPQYFCGMGVAAASGNACNLTLSSPDHLEVTTTSASGLVGAAMTITVKACANVSCSSLFTGGVTGTLAIAVDNAGVPGTATFPSGAAFTIASGSSSTTVSASMTEGTATVSVTSPSPSPTNTPKYFCGMGVAAASGNLCDLDINAGLHHLNVTTTSSTGGNGTTVTYTITACADVTCSQLYTGGVVTGTLGIAGVTKTFPAGAGISIAAGSSTDTVTVTYSATGTATASISSIVPTPSNATKYFCGMGVTAASGNSCAMTIQQLDHLEITAASASAVSGANVTFTVKACQNTSSPCTVYTGGVSGTFGISGTGVVATYPSGTAVTIPAGSSTTTIVGNMTPSGKTPVIAITALTPAASNAYDYFCGFGATVHPPNGTYPNACKLSTSAGVHHLEVTTASNSTTAGTVVTFTIKACSDAAVPCVTAYTAGTTGTLAISGVTPTFPSGAAYATGGTGTATVQASMSPAGTATVSVTSPDPTPSNTPKYYCGMTGTASSGGACTVTINQVLDHLEITTPASTVTAGNNVVFTVKACQDAACSAVYTQGVTGTVVITGVTPTFSPAAAFTIAAASSTTTVTASMTAGTATVSITPGAPTPTNTPKYFCGIATLAATGNPCTITVNPAMHHLMITTGSASAMAGTDVTFTVTACVDSACTTGYTLGASGILAISGVTPAFPSGAAVNIAATTSSTTIVANMSPAGTAAVTINTLSPSATNTPAVFCGFGVAASAVATCNLTITPALHHMEVTTSAGSGLTCTNPVTYTIRACGDASCSTAFTTGVTGNLSLSGGPTISYAPGFTIAAGNSTTTVNAYITTVGTVSATLGSVSPTITGSPAVYCGMGSAASSGGSCNFAVAAAGLIFDVPNHVSNVLQTVNVSAVRSADSATVCTPLFSSVSQSVNFKCGYLDPVSGTLPAKVGGVALNSGNNASAACDATGQSVSLAFNASGVASTTVQYADVGQVAIVGTYTGTGSYAGLNMVGADSFIAAPASFVISSVTAAPIKAGNNFSATVTAKNSSDNAVPNFGHEASPESATLTFTRYKPVGGANGTFSGGSLVGGNFSSGVATAGTLNWSEVGVGDLTATLTSGSYLGSGLTATGTTGSTGAVGPFTPHHFSISPSNACGAFTYSGQPFAVTVTALNALDVTTTNFAGSGTIVAAPSTTYPQGVTLTATTNGGTGSLSNATISGSSFTLGVAAVPASSTSPSFAFNTKQTVPTSVAFQAADAVYTSITSSGYTEGSVALRSGRLKMSNAFGSEKSSITVPVQAQYWGGNSWVINSADSCTVVPASAIGRSNYLNSRGAASSSWTTAASALSISGGSGLLTLAAPSPIGTGSVDIAFNLGSTTSDDACISSHATTTGAAMSWLRGTNASVTAGCPASLIDPSARITFGVYSPETKKTIHVREIF
jgi:hypothetical protein